MSTTAPAFVELAVTKSSNSKRTRYTLAERKAHCREWHTSGLSMNEYCRRAGLFISTFSQWVKRFNDKQATEAEESEKPQPQQAIEIILVSGICIRFTGAVNVTEILRIIRALESCS